MVKSVNRSFCIRFIIVLVCFFELFWSWKFILGYCVSRFGIKFLIILLVIFDGLSNVLFIVLVMVIECLLLIWIIELKFWLIVNVVICLNGIFCLFGVWICMFLRCFIELCFVFG